MLLFLLFKKICYYGCELPFLKRLPSQAIPLFYRNLMKQAAVSHFTDEAAEIWR